MQQNENAKSPKCWNLLLCLIFIIEYVEIKEIPTRVLLAGLSFIIRFFYFLGNKRHKQLRDSLEFSVEEILHLQFLLVVENSRAYFPQIFNCSHILHPLHRQSYSYIVTVNFEFEIFNCSVNLELSSLIKRICYFILLYLLLIWILECSNDPNKGYIVMLCQYISSKFMVCEMK